MKHIALLTPRLHEGDAVSNDVIGMRDLLIRRGHDARIFAEGWESGVRVYPLKKIGSFLGDEKDILLYHYSVAWDFARDLFRTLKCVKVIKYHNITPPHYFEPYHEGITNSCRIGREMLPHFVNSDCHLFLGDSKYNIDDLRKAGAQPELCRVVSPFHRVDELLTQDADESVLARYALDYPRKKINWLSVGRIVPNKGYLNLLRAFHIYHRRYNHDSRLFIVGRADPQLADYNSLLHSFVREHGLQNAVHFTGPVGQSALKSYYLAADIFLTLSEHEGFCVPLIEAMGLRIPVTALAATAIPETAGDGALLWEEPDPELFAATAHRLVGDRDLSFALASRGHDRYHRLYTPDRIKNDFLLALEDQLEN